MTTPENDETLRRLYVDEKKSSHHIARVLKCGKTTVLRRLQRMGVERRDLSTSHLNQRPTPEQRARHRAACKAKFQGEGHSQWKGGRITTSAGYISVWTKNHPHADSKGYVLEHRLVMEAKLGRCLEPGEVVHHINDVKTDNRPENLMLFKNNREHMAFHQQRTKTQSQ